MDAAQETATADLAVHHVAKSWPQLYLGGIEQSAAGFHRIFDKALWEEQVRSGKFTMARLMLEPYSGSDLTGDVALTFKHLLKLLADAAFRQAIKQSDTAGARSTFDRLLGLYSSATHPTVRNYALALAKNSLSPLTQMHMQATPMGGSSLVTDDNLCETVLAQLSTLLPDVLELHEAHTRMSSMRGLPQLVLDHEDLVAKLGKCEAERNRYRMDAAEARESATESAKQLERAQAERAPTETAEELERARAELASCKAELRGQTARLMELARAAASPSAPAAVQPPLLQWSPDAAPPPPPQLSRVTPPGLHKRPASEPAEGESSRASRLKGEDAAAAAGAAGAAGASGAEGAEGVPSTDEAVDETAPPSAPIEADQWVVTAGEAVGTALYSALDVQTPPPPLTPRPPQPKQLLFNGPTHSLFVLQSDARVLALEKRSGLRDYGPVQAPSGGAGVVSGELFKAMRGPRPTLESEEGGAESDDGGANPPCAPPPRLHLVAEAPSLAKLSFFFCRGGEVSIHQPFKPPHRGGADREAKNDEIRAMFVGAKAVAVHPTDSNLIAVCARKKVSLHNLVLEAHACQALSGEYCPNNETPHALFSRDGRFLVVTTSKVLRAYAVLPDSVAAKEEWDTLARKAKNAAPASEDGNQLAKAAKNAARDEWIRTANANKRQLQLVDPDPGTWVDERFDNAEAPLDLLSLASMTVKAEPGSAAPPTPPQGYLVVRPSSLELWMHIDEAGIFEQASSYPPLGSGGSGTASRGLEGVVGVTRVLAASGTPLWLVGCASGDLLLLEAFKLTPLLDAPVKLTTPYPARHPVRLISLAISASAADADVDQIAAGWDDGSVGVYPLGAVLGAALKAG